ncbi:hypothetical protein ADT25_07500 [Xanthomonas oryzae]|uniref:Uncharacterized protein n=1 Tax=Xanthomonas oryzae TaxID=347 RepID=A0AAP0ZNM6_9XANT|nr:hypothetical protein ADT25_07500 [Xanthomonas oryzae]
MRADALPMRRDIAVQEPIGRVQRTAVDVAWPSRCCTNAACTRADTDIDVRDRARSRLVVQAKATGGAVQ